MMEFETDNPYRIHRELYSIYCPYCGHRIETALGDVLCSECGTYFLLSIDVESGDIFSLDGTMHTGYYIFDEESEPLIEDG